MPGAPGYSTVRTQLRVLENKGHVRTRNRACATSTCRRCRDTPRGKSALKHLVDTFFDGSSAKAVAALLGGEASRVSDDELERIAELVKNARSDLAMSVHGFGSGDSLVDHPARPGCCWRRSSPSAPPRCAIVVLAAADLRRRRLSCR